MHEYLFVQKMLLKQFDPDQYENRFLNFLKKLRSIFTGFTWMLERRKHQLQHILIINFSMMAKAGIVLYIH